MTNRFTKAAALALGLLVAGGVGVAVAQGDPVAARKANFKMAADAMKAVKGVADAGGPTTAAVPEAEKLVSVARSNSGHFPTGSGTGDTKAKPDIWNNKADFDSKFKNFETASLKLVEVAQAGDAKALGAQFGQVGGTCKACHDAYRN